MVGNAGASSVEPVVNPNLREAKRQRHATVEITDLAEQAAEAAQAFRETLQQAALAAEALTLPESR